MKRAAVFVHYDRHNKIDDYVVYYVKSLTEVCNDIVFVTTSDAPESELSKLRQYCKKIIKRENIGYDFLSYKVGLQNLDSGKYDEVIICNDSVYGPLFSLSTLFQRMSGINCDFWGITESYDKAYHIQSYFVAFRTNVLESECFKKFWNNISIIQNKFEIIKCYEIGLSQILLKCGFKAKSYISFRPGIWLTYKTLFMSAYERKRMKKHMDDNYFRIRIIVKELFGLFEPRQYKVEISSLVRAVKMRLWTLFEKTTKLPNFGKLKKKLNPTHFFWKQLITECEMPFLKIELLRDNPMRVEIEDYESVIGKVSNYNIVYIKKHLERIKYDETR